MSRHEPASLNVCGHSRIPMGCRACTWRIFRSHTTLAGGCILISPLADRINAAATPEAERTRMYCDSTSRQAVSTPGRDDGAEWRPLCRRYDSACSRVNKPRHAVRTAGKASPIRTAQHAARSCESATDWLVFRPPTAADTGDVMYNKCSRDLMRMPTYCEGGRGGHT